MRGQGTDGSLVRIRIITANELMPTMAAMIADMLEKAGCEVLEWSTPFPCREPDGDKVRVYLMAKQTKEKGNEHGNGSEN